MVSFEFVVSDGTPKRATAAVRSHAVRNGLLQKNKDKSAASGKESSRLTIFRRSSLRGRFKVNDEQKAETRKRDSLGSSSRSLSGRPETIREASSSVVSESDSQAEALAEFLAETQGETPAETDLAVQPARPREISPTCYETTPLPPLLRGPGSPEMPEHRNSLKQRVDPFISLFLSYMNINVSSNMVTRKYFGFGVCDPIVLHSALGIAAMMWSISLPNPKKAHKEGYKQKALAIPCVHERLQANDVSNTVVGAIANLAQMETIEKNYDAARVHLRAIDIIAQKKGGYGSFVSELELATSLNWTDILCALMTDTKPTMMLLTNVDEVAIPTCATRLAEVPSVSHLRVFEEAPSDTTIRYTFTSVRQAMYASKLNLSVKDMRVVCNSIDHRLLMMVQTVPRDDIASPLLIAVQLFMALIVRETEMRCVMVESIVPRLKASLEPFMTCATLPEQEYWCGLTWCLWIGVVTTIPHTEKWEWFYQHLTYLVQKVGILDCVQFKTVMQRFLWDDFRCETAFKNHGPSFLWQTRQEATANRTTTETDAK